jgi:hypothetical protein
VGFSGVVREDDHVSSSAYAGDHGLGRGGMRNSG